MDYSESVRHSVNYINGHLLDDLSAEGIAKNEGYSVFHFCRVFKEVQGVSLMQYVRDRRLEQAHKEINLGKNKESLDDLAFKYGFETRSGFSRAYEKKYGIKPKKGA